MRTKDIAKTLKRTAQLMELHAENPFKIKSIANAAYVLEKSDVDVEEKSIQELEQINGIGKSIAAKIHELKTTNSLKELDTLLDQTPDGLIEMLDIKGIGPKKIRLLWKELAIESIGELLYACNENRLVTLKGFGAKTQEAVKKQIEFYQSNLGNFHYAAIEEFATQLVATLKEKYNTNLVSLTGAIRRKTEIINQVDVLIATTNANLDGIENPSMVKVNLITCPETNFYDQLFKFTGSDSHLHLIEHLKVKAIEDADSEQAIYESLNLQFIEPELREGLNEVELAKENKIPKLIEVKDLKGILHNHSTYSDGQNSLKEMAEYCKELGYEYLGISDHSQSAFYANGLKADRILQQHQEIDALNKNLAPFKIFKGIESDILNSGELDYPTELLKTFDFIVASVHSNLKMDEEKATARLIKAIENPFTTILGHPTGRLLLSRPGYPINHKKVIDACADNNVIMELNAHPYRLDLDWRWIHYCIEKGVKISINPDAHQKQGYHDMYYGTCVARKGMLTKEMCFNAFNLEEMERYFKSKK